MLARGDLVIAPVRDPNKLFAHLSVDSKTSDQTSPPLSERLHVFKFDLAESFELMKEKVNESVKVWGRIDVLVNNAAQLMMGTLEEGGYVSLCCCACPSCFALNNTCRTFRSEAMQQLFTVNFFGVINMTNAVLPHMREKRSGTVVMIGSRSAFRNEVYVSTPSSWKGL